ncbi:RNA polymerase sigma-32 factor [Pseudomonas mandelii JR-1]|uniref:RNA polymerase sigma-32 factor n=1 Tax=Pseudomonas mandelii JR-1 TaxID=1147786 RepID=A0A024EDM9_9PSED|nr:RNA polymerase sigma-32 factor [Pseudomonas mandelii JR-1]
MHIGLQVRTRDQSICRLQRIGHTKKPPTYITRAVQHCEN